MPFYNLRYLLLLTLKFIVEFYNILSICVHKVGKQYAPCNNDFNSSSQVSSIPTKTYFRFFFVRLKILAWMDGWHLVPEKVK